MQPVLHCKQGRSRAGRDADLAVGPRLGHRAIGVGRRQHARRQRELRTGGSSVVAGAVEGLVVGARDRRERRQERRAREDALGVAGCSLTCWVLVFVVVLFVGMQVVVQHDASADPRGRKFVHGVLGAAGLLYLAYFFMRALGDLHGFLTRENAEGFLVGPALKIALVPFLLAVAWLPRRELETCGGAFGQRLTRRLKASQ
jgi:hypothetical protein